MFTGKNELSPVSYESKLIMVIRLPVDDAGSLLAGRAVVYVLTSSV